MNFASRQTLPYLLILVAGVFAPFLFPTYSNEIAVLWLMIVFASTWDILGGQMGYNSLGNIFFFGAGMYICAIVQIGLYYDVGHVHLGRPHHPHRLHQRAIFHRLRARHRGGGHRFRARSPSSPAGSCWPCADPISRSARSASRSRRRN